MSNEKEQALLGGLMKLSNTDSDIANFVLEKLKPANFYTPTNREIFKAIKTLASTGNYFDNLSVIQATQNNSLVELYYIDACYQHRADNSLIKTYATQIKQESLERFAKAKVADLSDMISDPENGTISQRLGLAESVISGLIEQMQNREEAGLKDAYHWANEWLDNKEAFHSGQQVSYTLGIKDLDDGYKPKGIFPGSLIVVGARPKMGKTFLATKIVTHFVHDRKEAACIFSMEMRGVDIWERILAGKSKTNSDHYYSIGMENNMFWDNAGKGNNDLAQTNLFIDDAASVTIGHIKNEVRKTHKKHKVGVVVIDYLTIMGTDGSSERNDLKYGEITKQLKILSKEIGCIIVLLVQLNRGLESRPDKRPMPSDARDTGQIEQDCDLWIGLYRDAVYNADCGHQYTEAITRLNRNGDSPTAFLTLSNSYFEDVDKVEAHKVTESARIDKEESDGSTFSKKYRK